MKNDFSNDMVPDDHSIDDFLGMFRKRQSNFSFTCGQRILLEIMIDACKKNIPVTNQVSHQSDDVETEEDCDETQTAAEEDENLKKKHLCLLHKTIQTWISQQKQALICSNEFDLKIISRTYEQLVNGTIKLSLECPVNGCDEIFSVTYKQYQNYYKTKKKRASSQCPTPPRWYICTLTNHILNAHSTCQSSGEEVVPSSGEVNNLIECDCDHTQNDESRKNIPQSSSLVQIEDLTQPNKPSDSLVDVEFSVSPAAVSENSFATNKSAARKTLKRNCVRSSSKYEIKRRRKI
ncbi:hypothetical protein Bhyg_07803 [Pseudolycoriella hygida]|uniref:Uncharacterized protein n=1 Tax=Pseudolycoriella hygida TaxID=35572 RepID=A0A9Q0N3D3_9DIPT|nr:hypothetical protein Bhyg_07803 [Pseudolycoriella hygida]